ncbi:MAG: YdeI/OmpD-associated family protein [Acidimicrobiia bacterium]
MIITAEFRATILDKGTTPYLIVPPATATTLGLAGRVTVSGTLNGTAFERRSIHPWDDRFFIEIPRQLCRRAGIAVGDDVDVQVEITGDRLPAELVDLLATVPIADTAWKQLTASRQRQLANHIADGRQPATRTRRAQACVHHLTTGASSPWGTDPGAAPCR